MAAFAVGSELTAMNVGMAVCATRADIMKNQGCVALSTGHIFMHAAERITGLIVIEFRAGADRLPAGIGVAVLAGNGDRPMGIGHLRSRIYSGLLRV